MQIYMHLFANTATKIDMLLQSKKYDKQIHALLQHKGLPNITYIIVFPMPHDAFASLHLPFLPPFLHGAF